MASGINDFTNTFIARVFNVGLTIAIQGCLAWFLLPAGRGSYAVCLIFTSLLVYVFSLGSDIAFSYFVSSKRLSLSESITISFVLISLISFCAIFCGYIILQLPFAFISKASYSAFLLSLFYVPCLLYANIYLQLFTAIGSFQLYGFLLVLRELNRLILVLFFVLWLSYGVEGALLANICSDLIIIFLSLFFYFFRVHVKLVRIHWLSLKNILSYGVRYYLGRLSNILNFHIATIILAFFATKEEIGLFSVAIALTVRIEMIPDVFFAVIFPRVAASTTGRQELVAQCARISGLICGIILILLGIFAQPIIKMLFSPAFLASVSLVRILIIGTIVRCGAKIFVSYLLGTDHPGIASISVAIGVLINTILIYTLFPIFQLNGAAVSVTINYLFSSLILIVSFRYLTGLTFREILVPSRSDLVFLQSAIRSRFFRSTSKNIA